MADSVGLSLVETCSFPDFYARAKAEQSMLHKRLQVTEMTADECEVFGLYRLFVFEKL
jgi:hypothetical protein